MARSARLGCHLQCALEVEAHPHPGRFRFGYRDAGGWTDPPVSDRATERRLPAVLEEKVDGRKRPPWAPWHGCRVEIVERHSPPSQFTLHLGVRRWKRVSRAETEGNVMRGCGADARHRDQRSHELVQRLAAVQREDRKSVV